MLTQVIGWVDDLLVLSIRDDAILKTGIRATDSERDFVEPASDKTSEGVKVS